MGSFWRLTSVAASASGAPTSLLEAGVIRERLPIGPSTWDGEVPLRQVPGEG
jgi:hypothetical protein